MRAATYARYSSDKQRDTSIVDQLRNCEQYAVRAGFEIVAQFDDRAISGADNNRPGYQAMLAAAENRHFDVLLIDDLSRLARDVVEQTMTLRNLEFWGVRVLGVSEGFDSASEFGDMQAGVQGLFNARYLKELAKKTHRGLTGQVMRGMSAGGRSFGYRSIETPEGHRLEIDEEAAEWVLWIYEHYADNWSPQRLAHELNRLGIPSPRKSTWATSGLYGTPRHGAGILNNELYIGRQIWNRSRWVQNPTTKKWRRVERPQSEWLVMDRPELRIISDDLWHAVRSRMESGSKRAGKGAGRRPSALFSGILRCGKCGGAIVAVSDRAYGCAATKDRGKDVCTGVLIPRKLADARLVSHLRDDLLSPSALMEVQAHVTAVMKEAAAAPDPRPRIAELDREIVNIIDGIVAVGVSPALKERLNTAENERDRLKATLKGRGEAPGLPDVLSLYRARVLNLQEALKEDTARARPILAEMFGCIKLEAEGDAVYANIETRADRLMVANAASPIMVAGAGFGIWRRIRLK